MRLAFRLPATVIPLVGLLSPGEAILPEFPEGHPFRRQAAGKAWANLHRLIGLDGVEVSAHPAECRHQHDDGDNHQVQQDFQPKQHQPDR